MASLLSVSLRRVRMILRRSTLLQWCSAGLGFFFVISVACELNGSSVGMWSELLNKKDDIPGLIFSSPKRVRSDEWVVWTPAMLSQANQTPPFPIENPNLGAGRSPLIMSVPVAYYTTIFRPQLWGFFLFNFERGFSFYWCSKVFGLLFATAWCLRQLGVRSPGLAIFGTIWVFFSSYVQWWFSSPAMLPEMLASGGIALGCAVQLLRAARPWRLVAAFVGLFFFSINFLLCLYPPYQIPLLWLGGALLIGVWWEGGKQNVSATLAIARIGLALVLAVVLLIPFWFDVQPTLQLVAETVYPGARRSSGGDLSLLKVFCGAVGFFENEQMGPQFYNNIAEASNFYPLWPVAALVLGVASWSGRSRATPMMLAIGAVLLAFTLYCVVPWPRWLADGTLLSFSTERRILLPLGLANIFFCCFFLDRARGQLLGKTAAWSCAVVCGFALLVLLRVLALRDPLYLSDPLQLLIILSINGGVLALFFHEKSRKFLPHVFGTLLILSNAGINPVMSGLRPLTQSSPFQAIQSLSKADPGGKWIAFQTRYFAQLVKAAGGNALNGTKVVPDLDLLHRLDGGTTNQFTYNRYANIECELPRPGQQQPVTGGLIYPDLYVLYLSPDLPVLARAGYRYLLFPRPWDDAAVHGFTLLQKTGADLWIYRDNPAPSSSRATLRSNWLSFSSLQGHAGHAVPQ